MYNGRAFSIYSIHGRSHIFSYAGAQRSHALCCRCVARSRCVWTVLATHAPITDSRQCSRLKRSATCLISPAERRACALRALSHVLCTYMDVRSVSLRLIDMQRSAPQPCCLIYTRQITSTSGAMPFLCFCARSHSRGSRRRAKGNRRAVGVRACRGVHRACIFPRSPKHLTHECEPRKTCTAHSLVPVVDYTIYVHTILH